MTPERVGPAHRRACPAIHSGAAPVSNALFARSGSLVNPSAGPVRAMSDNGAYAYFDTADHWCPADTNGTLDVYEWHEGTCR